MIAYHVLCHDNFRQVVELVRALWTPDATILIDIDDGKRPDVRPLEALKGLSNVHVKRDANIGWGGGGTMRKTLLGAFELLELDRDWRYYVVLSGQDLPLKGNEVIRERLMAGDAAGTSFIRCHPADPVAVADMRVKNRTPKLKLWENRGHTRIWAKPGTISPHAEMGARTLVDVTEVGELGQVYIGLADPLLAEHRRRFFAKHPFHVGANWFNLHRSLVEHMRGDPFAYELYDVCRTTFIPDESYFQTYVMNTRFRDTADPDYGRLIVRTPEHPAPKVFGRRDWAAIEASDALFARKFDTRRDRRIVRRVLEAREADASARAA